VSTSTGTQRARTWLPAIVVGLAFLLLWEAFVVVRDIKPFLLPKPSFIWSEIVDNWSNIVEAARNTGTNALVGLVCGTVLGVLTALVANRFRFIRELSLPVAAAVSAMPIIAIAPILNNIFSTTSAIPRRLVVTIIAFFPIFMNVLRGLTQVDPVHQELMRSYAARDSTVMRKVRLPNALPFFFTGLKVAASLAVIAAVVAEYFGGLQNGLGSRITSAAANSAYGRAWAYVAASCALGLAFYAASLVLERVAMPWQAHRRSS
jgi:NitT/TauT family transport system permease protein